MGDDFRVGAWLIEPRLNTVSRHGVTIHLEPKVMEVLVYLAQHVGEPVAKEELLQAVWPDTFVTDDVLKRSISELRRAFEDDARESRIIQTIPKRGYRLIVPVEPINGEQRASPAQWSPQPARPVRRRWVLALVSGVATTLIALTLGGRSLWFGKSAFPQIRSIAVLPLENLSGDPTQEYLSDGMTDALITDLAQIGSLKVISRTSSMQYKQTKKSLPEIAHELKVDGIVEGTVQHSGDRVRITAQLIHGPSDKHLWANSYEQNMNDIFALEREVTVDIANQVKARLTTQNRVVQARPRTTNPKALEAYLQGTYHLYKYGRGAGAEEKKLAAEYFQQAIDVDHDYVPAYIGLANAHYNLPVTSLEDWDIERKAAETALTLDPNSSDAQAILAELKQTDLDWLGAEQQYRRALALNPNNGLAHEKFCDCLAKMGRLDEAWKECQFAEELDPNNEHLAFVFYFRGEYDQAIAVSSRMIENHPDDGMLHYLLFEINAKRGHYKESIEELVKAFILFGLSESAANIQHAFASFDFLAAMRQMALETERLQAGKHFYVPVNLADIYATLGEKDRAFYWLEQAYVNRRMIGLGEGVDFVRVDPMLEPLRSDPRFKDLLRRIGLPEIPVGDSVASGGQTDYKQ